MSSKLRRYLNDPFLQTLYSTVRAAGRIRSISVDMTAECNLRCKGCYYFAEGMDVGIKRPDDAAFEAFIDKELARGTNFVTVVGGEPSLELERLALLHQNFRINVATNGLLRIPYKNFETMPMGVAIWGNAATDSFLRGGGKADIISRAMDNYRNDPRAFWYYTVTPGHAGQIEGVVDRCVENGNAVLFNFYSDLDQLGDKYDGRKGFDDALQAIDRVVDRHPGKILLTRYLAGVISSGTLYGQKWGHEVCTSLSVNHPANSQRLQNGNPYNPHFMAYQADFEQTRRCCTGIDRDCDTCFDVWEHFSWVALNMKQHMETQAEFTNWLTSMYLFYLINRLIDYDAGMALLPEIHARTGLDHLPTRPQLADALT